MRVIDIFAKLVANENSFYLKLLGEVVCGGEFDDVLMRDTDEDER